MDRQRCGYWPSDLAPELNYKRGLKPLHEYLRDNARQNPEKAAIIWYGREISYGELNDLSDRFATALSDLGVRKGEPVVLFLSNSPQYFIAHYGIQKIGAAVCPCSPLFKEWELEYQLNDLGAKVIVASDSLYPIIAEVKPKTKLEHIVLTNYGDFLPPAPGIKVPEEILGSKQLIQGTYDMLSLMNAVEGPFLGQEVELEDIALIIYTSGTTGKPKGAMLSYKSALFKAAAVAQSSSVLEKDVLLTVVPLYHIAGMLLGLNCPIYANATVVLLQRFDPVAVLEGIANYRCTWWYSIVPMNLSVMQVPNAGEYDLSSLETTRATSFGIALTPEIGKQWTEFTKGCSLFEGAYGLSETHTADTFMPAGAVKWGTQGIANYETRIRILDTETGREKEPGEMGEIVISSPGVFKGYWQKPLETEQTLREGWVYTGDMGRLDKDHYLIFDGRFKEMIKVSGYSVFPEEVESMLIRHQGIAQAAVLGVSDGQKGEVVKAFVVLKPDPDPSITAENLIAWAREKMAHYKVPRYIEFRESLPVTGAGKILRRLLKEESS
ncbi:acyl-CoA synthetase (AMP-forming)/AMP-acid ligase II [Desulfosporosinus orientis DSM 765]|uniref:Acyl-CoA synthetase (AMP-forming)/AMP-acid ligase II n=1 Tax=Desulfosporosinus orientis (strain ATCC 19365 / DSM 765 / NCIMB 8382 / VKM B-1628 / Singapore I) TaxID=768706 RepID=G7WCL9_DESOD|nr:AMP-binding protein [Desulfosporosinus orientis]AET66557.1 acyl-CoA synthetase (AMP-forming)/AMP-acid ligase II [Desulfosporosinus orientis DSM 765]